jgi:hypothetical protein
MTKQAQPIVPLSSDLLTILAMLGGAAIVIGGAIIVYVGFH